MLSEPVSDAVSTTGLSESGQAPSLASLIAHTGGSLLIEGIAGAGKTRLLLDRFRWFVEQGGVPQPIGAHRAVAGAGRRAAHGA